MSKTMTLIFLSSFFLSGCGMLGGNEGTNSDIPDIHHGVEGLNMEFLKNTPPKNVFEESEFPILLRVQNQGTYTIEDEEAILSLGLERDYTQAVEVETNSRISQGNSESEATFIIEGKTIANPRGDQEVVGFTATAAKIDPQSETHPTTVVVTVCYPYQTKLTTDVCIDVDPNNVRPGKKACTVSDVSFSNGQGAPATITKIEVQMLPMGGEGQVRPQFIFHVENKGRGEVLNRDTYREFCRASSGAFTYQDINTIRFSALLPGQELSCSTSLGGQNEGLVRLKSKKDMVRCTVEGGIATEQIAYVAPLQVQMDYGYTQSISSAYTILKQG